MTQDIQELPKLKKPLANKAKSAERREAQQTISKGVQDFLEDRAEQRTLQMQIYGRAYYAIPTDLFMEVSMLKR